MAGRRRLEGSSGTPAPATGATGVEGIEQIMTAEVACVEEGAPVAHLHELLVERGQHCVPVVAPEGRPVGMITQTDLLRSLGETTKMTAGQIMTALVFALPVTASVEQAAALMAYEGVDQIVVTGLRGEVAGVVRALDVARRCARSAGYLVDHDE